MAVIAAPARAQLLGYGVRAPRPQIGQGIVHGLHSTQLRIACATPASSAGGVCPTVVFTGDSTSVINGNQSFNELETIQGQIVRRLKRSNPGVTTWNFIERGIPGTTWGALAGTPSFTGGVTAPSWYTSEAVPWVNGYIAPASSAVPDTNAPDLIIIMMGTNDLDAIALANIRTVFNLIANATNFPVTPDVWLCTTTGRTTDRGGSTQAQIDGVQLAASAVRTAAWAGPAQLNSTFSKAIGLLDFSRQDAVARLGYDPCRQVLEAVPSYAGLTGPVGAAVPFVLPECDGDFDYQVTFVGQATTLFTNGGNLRLVCSPSGNSGTAENQINLSRNTTLIGATWSGGGALTYNLANSTLGSGDIVVRVVAQQNEVYAICQGTRIMDTASISGSVPRYIGRFQPRIYMSVEPPASTVRCDFFRAGRRMQYAPTILEAQAWDRDGTTKYGGGTVNHPTSFHIAETVRAVLDAQSFCVAA